MSTQIIYMRKCYIAHFYAIIILQCWSDNPNQELIKATISALWDKNVVFSITQYVYNINCKVMYSLLTHIIQADVMSFKWFIMSAT